jgi:hypothetical protein
LALDPQGAVLPVTTRRGSRRGGSFRINGSAERRARALPHGRLQPMHKILLLLSLTAGVALSPALQAQSKTDKEEREIREKPEDPFTGKDPERMKAAGIVSYAPFLWSPKHRTEDIDRVLGEGRILWMETEHFVIGSTLLGCAVPPKPDEKKQLLVEVGMLRERLPEVPKRPKRLSPWLRLHLYAQRAELLYAEFCELVGVDPAVPGKGTSPPSGPYLGMANKFQLILFQKKSDLVRYLDRFAGVQADYSYRYYEYDYHQVLLASSLEIMESPDEPGFHGHFLYSVANNLVNSYRYNHGGCPLWLSEGLSHYFSRRVETDFINVSIKDGEAVNDADKHQWHKKVRARAQHDGAFLPFSTMAGWTSFGDLGYQGHIQSWSRVDFLMSLSKEKVGLLLTKIKNVPPQRATGQADPRAVRGAQDQALMELFGFDAETFDEEWRDWVLKTYPRR